MMKGLSTGTLLVGITIILAFVLMLTQKCDCALYARHDMTSSVYQKEFNKIVRKGYRLKLVNGYSSANNRALYTAIWVPNKDKRRFIARHGMSSGHYQWEFNKHVSRGYRLVHVSGFGVGRYARFAAIWEPNTDRRAWVARHGMTSQQYQTNFNKFTRHPYNFRLTNVNGYTVNGVDYYAAIWERRNDNSAWVARHGMTSYWYQRYFDQYGKDGFRLTKVSGYQLGGTARYAAIWEKKPGPSYYARHGLSSAGYQAAFNHMHHRGYELEYVDGYLVGSHVQFAAIWHKRNN